MKHRLVIIAILASVALISGGCKSGRVSSANAVSAPVERETSFSTTTVERVANVDSTIRCKFTIDYPTGTDSFSLAVNKFLHDQLAQMYLPRINDPDAESRYPLYDGNVNKGETVVGYYADGTLEYLKQTLKDMQDEGIDWTPTLEYDLSITKMADTTRYVSYEVKAYAFLGGAHGSSSYHVEHIAKPSGKVIELTVDTLQTKALQPLLRKGVINYFHEMDERDVDDSNLDEHLLLMGDPIPVPVCAPYLAPDGVHFVYQQYEIAPYAVGLVSFTVPYAEIKKYLTPEARELIE